MWKQSRVLCKSDRWWGMWLGRWSMSPAHNLITCSIHRLLRQLQINDTVPYDRSFLNAYHLQCLPCRPCECHITSCIFVHCAPNLYLAASSPLASINKHQHTYTTLAGISSLSRFVSYSSDTSSCHHRTYIMDIISSEIAVSWYYMFIILIASVENGDM